MMWNADDKNPGGTAQSSEEANENENAATPSKPTEERKPRRRGFAAMDRDRVREIASKGGKAAHSAGTAHQFSSEEARVAGRKGGMAPHVRRGGVRRRTTTEGATTSGHTSHGHAQGEHGGEGR